AEMIHKLFEECIDKNKEKEFYLCGPGNFILKTEKILIDSNIDSKHIHKEYFSTLTNVTDEANKRDKFLPSASLKFKLGNIESKVETNPGEKILDALIRNGFEPPYSCSSGACATCIAKLHKGEVIMDSDLALDKSEIEAGWILTCQSRCASKEVEISYQE
ncbi:MAG: 2Fe-2S iron-sulfur cluster-binding protein, partial [Saprospiraceae bacterium]